MSAPTAVDATDRSDFRTVLIAGTKAGGITAAGVAAFLVLARLLPDGMPRQGILTLVVLATGVALSFLPARWLGARQTEGIAGTAAAGLWGTVVFMAFDIIVLRPLKAYPWTWDAIGGNSTWWYLPIWWMLGTFVVWMGAIVTAGLAARGNEPSLGKTAGPVVIAAAVVATVARLAGVAVPLPVLVAAAYTATLAAFAIVSLARKA